MLDREMGNITEEMSRLAHEAGMTPGELEAACRMWFEQHGPRWYDVGLSALRERIRNVDRRMLAEVNKVLSS